MWVINKSRGKLMLVLVLMGTSCSGLKNIGQKVTKLPLAPEETTAEGLNLSWDSDNNPSRWQNDFNYSFAELPLKGEASQAPWAGSYWPTYLDSINYRWDGSGSRSATQKYQTAFQPPYNIVASVSQRNGVNKNWGKGACSSHSDCSAAGGYCIKTSSGYGQCIPTWYGICHAWAPAAIYEPEPKKSVVFNGVEFKVNDIKALLTYGYTSGVSANMLSKRCNTSKGYLRYDTAGTPLNIECADSNAGTFHVAVTNMLGIRKKSFIEDRDASFQVWNHPVRKYDVLQNTEVTAAEANRLTGYSSGGAEPKRYAKEGTLVKEVFTAIGVLPVAKNDEVVLTLTSSDDADIYAKFNDRPTLTAFNCRPQTAGTKETCTLKIPEGVSTVYIALYAKNDASYRITATVSPENSATYARNPEAKTFRSIRMRLYYIKESDPRLNGNLASAIENYTRYDEYVYVLELDGNGKIIGGEWGVGSKTQHPDFLWIAPPKQNTVVSGIKWSDVQLLLKKSIE